MKDKISQFKILVVDDNPAIHEDFRKIFNVDKQENKEMQKVESILFEKPEKSLNLPEYIIDNAANGEDGLALVEKNLKEAIHYSVIFMDVRMPPGWDGVQTAVKVWKLDPNVQIVLCTAFSDYSWEDMLKELGQRDDLLVLKKPFDNIEVRQLVLALCKKWLLAKKVRRQVETLQEMVNEKTFELQSSISLLRATFESTADGILVTNNADKIIDLNSKFIELWEIPTSILESRQFHILLEKMTSQLASPDTLLKMTNNFSRHLEFKSFDILKFKDDRIFECYSQPQLLDEKIIGRVWNFRDITKRKQLEEQLTYQATHDILTGLSNRTLLLNEVEKSIKKAKQSNVKVAILFFDLDQFKLINDSLGHTAGDQLVKAVATRMRQCARPTDTLARLGGDEFVVLIPILHQEEEIISIIKRFLMVISNPFNINDNIFNITASVGISLYPKDGTTAEVLLKNADAAMYRAKELGRNNFQFFTPSMNMQAIDRLELGNDLSNALAKNELMLYYQPVFDVVAQKIIGVEALIRWNHPKRGFLSPLTFIPIAEETGLIVPIGEWVLRTACKQVKAWHDLGLPKIWVAVNISASQFKNDNLLSIIENILTETKLDPTYLCLEITEGVLLDATSKIGNLLTEIRKKGITIAIDDFGIGYSSLNYINRFPIDKLKIDRSFIRDLTSDINDSAVILAIIGMARSLGMKVIAEGVENLDQLEFLEINKCDAFQGFLAAKPGDSNALEKLLRANSKFITKK